MKRIAATVCATNFNEDPENKQTIQRAVQESGRQQGAPGSPSYATDGYQPQRSSPTQAVPGLNYVSQFRPHLKRQQSCTFGAENRSSVQYDRAGSSQCLQGCHDAQAAQPPNTYGYQPRRSCQSASFDPDPVYQYPVPVESRRRSRDRRKQHQQMGTRSVKNTFLDAGSKVSTADTILIGIVGMLGGALLLGDSGKHEYGKQKPKDTGHDERRYSDHSDPGPRRREQRSLRRAS